MKNLVIFFSLVFWTCISAAQQVPYFKGELIVQLSKGTNPESVEHEFTGAMGIRPAFKAGRCISAPLNCWLFTFDENEISAAEMRNAVSVIQGVTIVQLNHIISNRDTTPDDPFFTNQWHHHDAQDNDIDSDLAWDITTGGTTATGDDIVACVVETGGASWNHTDLAGNHWVNENEIPDNDIDDDDNGYVDDYNGWNINSDSDVISGGNHGTQVSSMIGATGNNNTGISGVNWNVKLMEVQMGNVSEANVIEAYTYPLVMRKLYNETNGEKGAFVVVTNSSWGIDNGQPSESPLWCAMYDSLGTYGVLSCGATANNNVNVDVVGDLPTACPSDYLISVTATDANDVRDFSGYGITTIDLGAPGDQVYLASNTNNYSNATGTSFASPCVAGAVALLYSAPCTSFMTLAYAQPSIAALNVKDYILEGVDAVANLEDEVVSGGRLNVNSSLLLLIDECNNNDCLSPFFVNVNQVVGTFDYVVTWGVTENMVSFDLRYRPVGNLSWSEINGLPINEVTIMELLACTEYELQVMAYCDSGESEWCEAITWITDGCCVNPEVSEIIVSDIEPDSFTLSWPSVTAAVEYIITVVDSMGSPQVFFTSDLSLTIGDLEPCTVYTITIESNCGKLENPTPVSFEVNTPGCTDCSQQEYCSITANASAEWIANVQLNTIDNTTESDDGYGDYSDLSTTLDIGASYNIFLTPGYASASFGEYFMVWIDYDVDGEFDANELVFDAGDTVTETVTGSFMVPWNGVEGSTRMRVGMSWVGTLGGGGEPVPCGENDYGETEDYCIYINTDVSVNENAISTLQVFPNPVTDMLTVNHNVPCKLTLQDATGNLVLEKQVTGTITNLDVSKFAAGIYILNAQISTSGKRVKVIIH